MSFGIRKCAANYLVIRRYDQGVLVGVRCCEICNVTEMYEKIPRNARVGTTFSRGEIRGGGAIDASAQGRRGSICVCKRWFYK